MNRPVLNLQAQFVGPVFNRIWDTPRNGYAEKFKHSIEPFVTVDRTTSVEKFNLHRAVRQHRFSMSAARHSTTASPTASMRSARSRPGSRRRRARSSTSKSRSAITPTRTQRSTIGSPRSRARSRRNFSAIALSVRVMPTNELSTTVRADFDSRVPVSSSTSRRRRRIRGRAACRRRSAGARRRSSRKTRRSTTRDSWTTPSTRRATAHTIDNRFGGVYSFNYDVLRSNLLQQRISAFYNAQCCGLAFEYQTYNYGQRTTARRSRATTASSCRSRSPAWATSRPSTAR